VKGLQGIIAFDKDGVVIFKSFEKDFNADSIDDTFTSTVALMSDQAGKLRQGKNDCITAIFGNHTMVHVNMMPLIVTLIANEQANLGTIRSLIPDLRLKLDVVRQSVQSASMDDNM
jgi:predicted regulator of Ras-like GTPase activity (Roadblock/LC7/MglB family)